MGILNPFQFARRLLGGGPTGPVLPVSNFGLALGGGGAKGLAHIVFLQELERWGLRPRHVTGTSVGAIVGAFYCAGVSPAAMRELILKVRWRQLSSFFDFNFFRGPGLIGGDGFEEFLYQNLPVRKFHELKIPLSIIATDFWARQQMVLNSGFLIPAVRASISLPLLLEPVRLDGRVLVDGGLVNPLPFDALDEKCDMAIAIDVSGVKEQDEGDLPNNFEVLASSFQILENSVTEEKIRRDPPEILMRPRLKNIRVLEFNAYQKIFRDASKLLPEFRRQLALYFPENQPANLNP